MPEKPQRTTKNRASAKIETIEPLVLMSASSMDGGMDILDAEIGADSGLVLELEGHGTL